MSTELPDVPPSERLALAAGWALVLAPVVAHTVWRPLLVALGAEGDAGSISLASLVVAAAAVLGLRLSPPRHPALGAAAAAAAAAILAALMLGSTGPAFVAAAAALLAVAGLVSAALPMMLARSPAALDGLARRKPRAALAMAVLWALAAVQTARLSTFMGDATRIEHVPIPLAEHFNHHACMTAYVQAAKLAEARVDNLYDADWWPSLGHSPTGDAQARAYAPFELDAYAYPPPFLLAPRLLRALSHDFSAQRALWYGVQALTMALGLWLVGVWIAGADARAGVRALLLAPLIVLAPPVLVTLQAGNVHLVVVVMAVVGMLALQRGRPALGGALLAFSILAKISPGLLGVVLLVQRRWRDALWTAGFGLLWTLLALIVFGSAPFAAFIHYQLPRLRSGAALEFFTGSIVDIAANMAPAGLPYKLEALGLALGDASAAAATIGTLFTLVAIALTVVAGRRSGDLRIQVGLWLAVLTLGALRSPFAPPYVGFAVLWLLSLWAAELRRPPGAVALALAFVLLCVTPPLPDAGLLLFSMVQQALLLALVVWFIVRPTRPPS